MEEPPKKKRRKLGRLEIKTKKIEKELAKIEIKAAAFREKLCLENQQTSSVLSST